MEICLVVPSMEYEEQILRFRQELLEADDGEDSFAGCGSLRECERVAEWLEALRVRADEKNCPPGKVSSDTYLAIRIADNRVVGIIDLRHHIDHPILSVWGGHMGYSVRPSERRKGYGTQMLRLNLENCRARNMEKVLITCSEGNIASEKTILANGGIFEKNVYVDGDCIKRYWITLGDRADAE